MAAQTASLSEVMNRQLEVIEVLQKSHEELRARMDEGELREQSRGLLQACSGQRESDRAEIQRLGQQIQSFQERLESRVNGLEGARTSIAGATAGSPTPALGDGSPPMIRLTSVGSEEDSNGSNSAGRVAELIRKLEERSEPPQARFVELLQGYSTEGEEWTQAFPPGYRTRVAPEFLADVYGQGATGEKWARRFVEDRCAQKSTACRELISTMMAVDSLVHVDFNCVVCCING